MKLFDQTFKFKLKKNGDSRGFFIEIFKCNKIKFKNKITQVSHSFVKNKILKGWHYHKKQTQWNYLLKGRIKIFLIDNRRDSKTYKRIRSFTINANKERIAYFFPANIGHAYLTYDKENHMIYGTSGYYDKNEEYKIKFDKKLIKEL